VLVYLTGVLELLGAVGLVIANTRRVAGLGLAALYIMLLPANIYAAVNDVPLQGEAPTPLWLRVPEQVLYIAVALWVSRSTGRRGDPAVQPERLDDVRSAQIVR
jgi:uncharacterized membrane protein